MKTKEIDCYVHKDINLTDARPRDHVSKSEFINSVKAKLIIELPEKKIEITESDFDLLVIETDEFYRASTGDTRWVDKFKQKLFGKDA